MEKQNSVELDGLGQQFFSESLMMILDLLVEIFILNPKWKKRHFYLHQFNITVNIQYILN